MKIEEMIKYFKGVKSQHEALSKSGFTNPNSEAIIKTYDFVISKLEEWSKK